MCVGPLLEFRVLPADCLRYPLWTQTKVLCCKIMRMQCFRSKVKIENALLKNGSLDRKMFIDTVLALNGVYITIIEAGKEPRRDVDKLADFFGKIADSVVIKSEEILLKLLDKNNTNVSASDKTESTKNVKD